MSNQIILDEENAYSYDRLFVTLEAGLGSLQILLAVCDNGVLRQQIIEQYEQEIQVQAYRLSFNRDEPSLLQALIDGQIGVDGIPTNQAIATVTGAEAFANNPIAVKSFLGYLQWTREALRQYPMPIVIWLPSRLMTEVAKKARDFWSWRGGIFKFQFAPLVFPVNPDRDPADNPTIKKSSSALSISQLESSLAEALTTWGEDSANIEPIYAQLGRAYSERVWQGEADNLIQEIALAETYLNKAIALQKRYNRKYDLTYSLDSLGYMYSRLGEWNKAEVLYKESLLAREELGDRSGMAAVWGLLGDIERKRGNWDAAESLYRQCLAVEEELGDRSGMATSWGVLGDIERNRGNWDAAESLYRQSLQMKEELGDRSGMASSWGLLGDIERNRGNWDAAESLYRQSLQVNEELGDFYKIAVNNFDFALLEKQRDHLPIAQQYYDKAKSIYQQLGAIKDLERIEQEWTA
jgi:tetratricopeptide (TPR) repeat protein